MAFNLNFTDFAQDINFEYKKLNFYLILQLYWEDVPPFFN
jgi:hypothetical protein